MTSSTARTARSIAARWGERPLKFAPEQSADQLSRIEADTWFGMAVSSGVAFFVMLTAAVLFHAHGITGIRTTEEAAEAPRPIAGRFAHVLFSFGRAAFRFYLRIGKARFWSAVIDGVASAPITALR